MLLKTFGALALTLAAYAPVSAQEANATEPHAVWLDTGFATYHFESDRKLNGRNPGVGLEYRFTDTMAATVGRFYNSDRKYSRYGGLYYQPWTLGAVKLGGVVGAFDGYPKMRDGGWFVALIPAATYEYKRVGVNVALIPKYKNRLHGGVSVQLKVKLWD